MTTSWEFRSAVPGVAWPAIPGQEAATLLALEFQLERSQWLAAEKLRELQFQQLHDLLRHAYRNVSYYRERWQGHYDPEAPLTPERFSRLPLLRRGDLQAGFAALTSAHVPAAHGAVRETRTSGSTGQPVKLLKTGLTELIWRALTLRDHLWHRRDPACKLGVLRMGVPDGAADGWGPATDAVAATGRRVSLSMDSDVDTQLDWLAREQPHYLLCYPSTLVELASRSLARGLRMPWLRAITTISEVLPADARELCRQAWGVPVTDIYSSQEVGQIALQCPECTLYHVQSEAVLVEVLDDTGRPCGTGELGRVVVTALHNYAMPLVRYEIGDYAERGSPCACGRGLPVLARVAGRARNLLVLADGRRYWPRLGSRMFVEVAPVLQAQYVQKDFDLIEVKLVVPQPLGLEQEERLRRMILEGLPPGMRITFSYCDRIARGAGGKYEDFVSEIATPR